MLKVVRLTESAKLPERGTDGSAGLDLFSDQVEPYIYINPGETKEIPTGIAIELPPGTVGLFLDKGSMGKKGIHNYAGVIDSDYRGELFVFLHNSSDEPLQIMPRQKITQMVVVPYIMLHPYEVNELSDTVRGNGRYGSTGAF